MGLVAGCSQLGTPGAKLFIMITTTAAIMSVEPQSQRTQTC